jgi:hypothetical protein
MFTTNPYRLGMAMNVERWKQTNPPMVQDSDSTKLLRATVYKFDKNGKVVKVEKRG